MPQINQLPTRTPVAGDTVPFYSSNNGDAAKTSFTAIATLMTQLMGVSGGGGFITQYSQPTATAFTVVVGGIGQSTWLIVTPTAAGFSGTITFPDVSTVADQQELIISTTNDVLLTYVATGMTVFGAPATLTAGSSAVFKYNLVSKFWYCISGSSNSNMQPYFLAAEGGSITNTVIASGGTYEKVIHSNQENGSNGISLEYDEGDTSPYYVFSGDDCLMEIAFVFSCVSSITTDPMQFKIGSVDDPDALSNIYQAATTFAAGGYSNVTATLFLNITDGQTFRLWATSPEPCNILIRQIATSIKQVK